MASNQTEIRSRSRTFRATAAVSRFRVVTQGADSTDFFRTVTQAALITSVPAGISRNAIASGEEGSVGQAGEFPVEVAAAVAINDELIVDAVGAIGRVKPKGATVAPYWRIGIARSAQATVGGICQIEYNPVLVTA